MTLPSPLPASSSGPPDLILAGIAAAPTAAIAVVIAFAIAVAAIAVIVTLRSHRRHAAQLARVVARLERLERLGALHEPGSTGHAERSSGRSGDSSHPTPTGDVLAGLTSHVRRMVEDDEADPVTLADEAIVCIYRHIDEPFAPRALSSELCVSLRSLERGLSAGLGCAPRELIRTVKMREARRLLEEGRFNVAEVASRTGFSSPFHFSRSFKDFFGVAPSKVRPGPQEAARAQRR